MDLGSQYIDPLVKMLWELWRFVLEVENIEIKQDLLVVNYFCWYRYGTCIQDYRCGLTLIMWCNFRYD